LFLSAQSFSILENRFLNQTKSHSAKMSDFFSGDV